MPQAITEPVAHLASAADATSYALGAFTPAANAVLLVFVFAENTVAAGTMTGGGLTWTKNTSVVFNTTATGYLFWAYTGSSPASCTITFDCTGDAATACMIAPFQITGSDVVSADPIRQVKTNATSSTNPTATMDVPLLTGNVYCAAFGANINPPASTQPTSWTETFDEGVGGGAQQPFACGAAYRVNGESGSTVTFTVGSSAWGMIVAELKATSTVRIIESRSNMLREVRKNEAVAAKRRVYFDVRTTDGLTPAAAETSGQPQISVNGLAWTNTGIGALAAIIPSSRGRYYADLTQASISGASVGDVYESRYVSANTIESPGDVIVVVPNLSIQGNVSDSTPSVGSIRVYPPPSPTTNEYLGQVMLVTGGVNAGKTRKISAYVAATGDFQFIGSTGEADAPWNVACTSGDPVEVIGRIR